MSRLPHIFYARTSNGERQWETAAHHMKLTGMLCGDYLAPIGYEAWGLILGELHDLGKYSPLFQEVLCHIRTGVDHASPGGAAALSLYDRSSQVTARLLASVIAAHHSRLSFAQRESLRRLLTGAESRTGPDGREFSLFGMEEFQSAMNAWRQDFAFRRALPPPPDFSGQSAPSLARMLFARFLFSALVDADWSAAATHGDPDYLHHSAGPELDPGAAMDRLNVLLREKRELSTGTPELNMLRDRLFENCLEAAALEPGLFTLTAPTGLGKTLSMLAFALEHCRRYGKRRVILVLPFLSILEQNGQDYSRIIPDMAELHSNARIPEGARELYQRWAAPCILTTNVGFLEPLFSARRGDLRHLHQISNSVILFDEAQSLPPHLLDTTLETIKLLCSQYRCTVVLSTATQPSFQFRPGLAWTPREIVDAPETLYKATRRVQYEWRVNKASPMPLDALVRELSREPQGCVIVNLRRHARAVYRSLTELRGDDVFFLTSDLCPAHRTALLRQVRNRLTEKRPCLLVATQCIEAGVDVDFPVMYRALAPLESIIQAAGRCNRSGRLEAGRVVVFLPEDGGRLYPGSSYERGANCVITLLDRHPINCHDPTHIQEYYELLYTYAQGDRRELTEAIQGERFDAVESAYRIIDDRGVQVIVPYQDQMELYRTICERYDREGLTSGLMKEARPITVSSFARDAVEGQCKKMAFRRGPWDEIEDTGWYLLGIPEFYDLHTGLTIEQDRFDGII